MLLSKQIESGNFETQKPQISIILKINYVTSHEKKKSLRPCTFTLQRYIHESCEYQDPSLRKKWPYSELFNPNTGKCGLE